MNSHNQKIGQILNNKCKMYLSHNYSFEDFHRQLYNYSRAVRIIL